MAGKLGDEDGGKTGAGKVGVEAALEALKHRHRRALLDHLANVDGTVDVTEAARTIAASDVRSDPDDLRFDLYHLHLPKLADLGIIEFDDVSEEIRYRPDPRVEALLDTIDEWW